MGVVGNSYLENLARYRQLFKERKVSELFSELKKTSAFPKMGKTRVRNISELETEYITRYGQTAKNFPYSKISPVIDFELEEIGYFVRVYADGVNPSSTWIFRIEDLRSYKNADELMEALALPMRPTKVALVEVPAGTPLRKSTAGAQTWDNGLIQSGGGIQYEIRSEYKREWFEELVDINEFFK